MAGAEIVPGATGLWPTAAPTLMVPVAPALAPTMIALVLLTSPPSEIVSVPVEVPVPVPGNDATVALSRKTSLPAPLNHLMNMDQASGPRMPRIKKLVLRDYAERL